MTGENRPATDQPKEGNIMDARILPRNEVETAACLLIEALVSEANRLPAQGRWARRGRYVASNRPAMRRPAVG
jgi:hypothetical protein